jgi:hypothetical protein
MKLIILDTGVNTFLIAKSVFVSLGARKNKYVVLDANGDALFEDIRKHSVET